VGVAAGAEEPVAVDVEVGAGGAEWDAAGPDSPSALDVLDVLDAGAAGSGAVDVVAAGWAPGGLVSAGGTPPVLDAGSWVVSVVTWVTCVSVGLGAADFWGWLARMVGVAVGSGPWDGLALWADAAASAVWGRWGW
jgi:hypothetical protein